MLYLEGKYSNASLQTSGGVSLAAHYRSFETKYKEALHGFGGTCVSRLHKFLLAYNKKG